MPAFSIWLWKYPVAGQQAAPLSFSRATGLTKLAFDVVEPSDLLGEDALEGTDVSVQISELDQAELAQGIDDLAADFVGNV
jgi:hypothetical protein